MAQINFTLSKFRVSLYKSHFYIYPHYLFKTIIQKNMKMLEQQRKFLHFTLINYFLSFELPFFIEQILVLQLIAAIILKEIIGRIMNSLKAALGKVDTKTDKLSSNISVSRKRLSNSKSESIWAFQNEDNNVEVSLNNDQKLDILNNLIRQAYEKDSHISSVNKDICKVTLDCILQDFQQQQTSKSPSKSQISYYLVLQDKVTDLIEIFSKSDPQYAKYLQQLHQNIQQRISSLRNKDKQTQLKNFDKIVGNTVFKKKVDYLDVGGIKQDISKKSRDKSRAENSSKEKKLNRLFSKQEDFKQKQPKKHQQQDHDDYMLSESMSNNNESVSYSVIISSSVAVKQRRPRKRSTKPDDFNFNKTQLRSKKSHENQNEEQVDKTDKAFIFFRPKKGAKY